MEEHTITKRFLVPEEDRLLEGVHPYRTAEAMASTWIEDQHREHAIHAKQITVLGDWIVEAEIRYS